MNAIIGSICTFAASALAFLFGLIYLTRPKFMNYHRIAVEKEWEELPVKMQTLITALMRALSSGFLAGIDSTTTMSYDVYLPLILR